MDKKTTGIIATIAAVLLCGCPGLFGLCWGAVSALVSFIPGADIDMFGSNDPSRALMYGIGTFCVGIIFIAIPIAVGFFTLRDKSDEEIVEVDEPLPPAI